MRWGVSHGCSSCRYALGDSAPRQGLVTRIDSRSCLQARGCKASGGARAFLVGAFLTEVFAAALGFAGALALGAFGCAQHPASEQARRPRARSRMTTGGPQHRAALQAARRGGPGGGASWQGARRARMPRGAAQTPGRARAAGSAHLLLRLGLGRGLGLRARAAHGRQNPWAPPRATSQDAARARGANPGRAGAPSPPWASQPSAWPPPWAWLPAERRTAPGQTRRNAQMSPGRPGAPPPRRTPRLQPAAAHLGRGGLLLARRLLRRAAGPGQRGAMGCRGAGQAWGGGGARERTFTLGVFGLAARGFISPAGCARRAAL